MSVWALIVAPLVVVVISFFVLPILEKPRDKFLRWTGIRQRKSAAIVEMPKDSATIQPANTGISVQTLATRLDAVEIAKAIRSAPLLQQPEISKHYVGIRIECDGELGNIDKLTDKKVRVLISVYPPSGKLAETVSVFFTMELKDYPGFGLLKYDDPIRVSGIIEKAEPRSLFLIDPKIISYGR